jgi:hypothetical protein
MKCPECKSINTTETVVPNRFECKDCKAVWDYLISIYKRGETLTLRSVDEGDSKLAVTHRFFRQGIPKGWLVYDEKMQCAHVCYPEGEAEALVEKTINRYFDKHITIYKTNFKQI